MKTETALREKPARVLSIAGSDSGGGAGLQADIKTLTALNCYAMTAVTAITVQDTTGVYGVHAVPPDIVRGQIVRVLNDIGADAIKIGMLGNAETVETVADALRAYESIPLVLDTVMFAKGGASLVDASGAKAMREKLVPRASLVTPNAPEAAALADIRVENVDDLIQAAQALIALGAEAALVKGGHLEGVMVTDVLATAYDVHLFEAFRLDSRSTHGTGCTLASACAAGLAQGMALYDAVARAHRYVQDAIRTAPGFGHGVGPLNHMHNMVKDG
jgi:hydroxymethylpyrimidine/phosphomethylpyrimidine kinase